MWMLVPLVPTSPRPTGSLICSSHWSHLCPGPLSLRAITGMLVSPVPFILLSLVPCPMGSLICPFPWSHLTLLSCLSVPFAPCSPLPWGHVDAYSPDPIYLPCPRLLCPTGSPRRSFHWSHLSPLPSRPPLPFPLGPSLGCSSPWSHLSLPSPFPLSHGLSAMPIPTSQPYPRAHTELLGPPPPPLSPPSALLTASATRGLSLPAPRTDGRRRRCAAGPRRRRNAQRGAAVPSHSLGSSGGAQLRSQPQRRRSSEELLGFGDCVPRC